MALFSTPRANRPLGLERLNPQPDETQLDEATERAPARAATDAEIRLVGGAATRLVRASDSDEGKLGLARLDMRFGTRRTTVDGVVTFHTSFTRRSASRLGAVTIIISGPAEDTPSRVAIVRDQGRNDTRVVARTAEVYPLDASMPVIEGKGQYEHTEALVDPRPVDLSCLDQTPGVPLDVDQVNGLVKILNGLTDEIIPSGQRVA